MTEATDRAAGDFLTAVYPDEPQRAKAERWLGILACQAAARRQPVRWWEIAALAPAQLVLDIRLIVLGVASVAVTAGGMLVAFEGRHPSLVIGYAATWFIVLRLAFGAKKRPRRLPLTGALRTGQPWAIRSHWPRGGRELVALLLGALPLGLGILPVLVRQWTVPVPPGSSPAAAYRDSRRAGLLVGLAWAPAGLLFGLLAWGSPTADPAPAAASPATTAMTAITRPTSHRRSTSKCRDRPGVRPETGPSKPPRTPTNRARVTMR